MKVLEVKSPDRLSAGKLSVDVKSKDRGNESQGQDEDDNRVTILQNGRKQKRGEEE